MKKNVLVIGSLNMDYVVYVNNFPKNGETIVGTNRSIQPGGKGENQAVAVARSNKVSTNFIGAIGNDNDGKEIQKILNENEINSHLKVYDSVTTGNATIIVNSSGENKIIIVEGANGKLSPNDIDIELIKQCDYVILQNEISSECNEFVIREASKLSKVIVYNPAPYKKIDEDLFQYIDYFIPNKGELYNYTNISDPIKASKTLLSKGVKNVLVTLGIEGSLFINKDNFIKVPAFKVNAIDTVAAGDTYVGYFVSGIASGLTIKEAMKKASLASSITVSRKGSVNSIPFGDELYSSQNIKEQR